MAVPFDYKGTVYYAGYKDKIVTGLALGHGDKKAVCVFRGSDHPQCSDYTTWLQERTFATETEALQAQIAECNKEGLEHMNRAAKAMQRMAEILAEKSKPPEQVVIDSEGKFRKEVLEN